MNEPIIQANASLVRNGDFRNGYSGWERDNQKWLSRVWVEYEKEQIYCLTAGNQASVSQVIDVPKDLRAEARYVLGFLCESRHYNKGRVEISIEGSPEPAQVIEILPGSRQANKAPRLAEFKPEVYNVELTLPLKKNDRVRVSVFSPPNQEDEYGSLIYITRIHLFLHLEPLVLQHLIFDGEPVSPVRPLYLCLGASGSAQHTLGFVPEPGNAWLDTEASLNSDDNPQRAIVARPMWGEDHPLDRHWTLDCPVIEGEEPHELSFKLLNKYTADAYPINVSLGHHRLRFGEVKEAAYYPVLEYKQSVQLGVKVVSHYTGEPLLGREVTWSVNGALQGVTLLTDDEGWVYFTYEPMAAGEFVIMASVVSLYYPSGVFTQAFDVRVLATDPWKEVMAVVDGMAALWDEKTGYPNRGSEYPVILKLPDSLLGTELWLIWEGDSPVELGVTVRPELKEPVPVTVAELSWMLTCDDRLDGRFELLLGCSKLLLPSRKKPMSLARNVVEIGEVRAFNTSPVVDEGGRALLMVQVLHVRTSGRGEPVVNALVDWVGPNGTVSTVTGADGWASVLDTPKSSDPYTLTAQVRAHADMSPIERQFDVTPLASSSWKGKAEFHLEGEPVDLATVGIACLRGESPVFRVTPTEGSPVKDKPMTLTWSTENPDLGLTIGAPTATPAGGWEWQLSSETDSSSSGLFELTLKSDALPEARALSGRLLSSDLADEASILLDQVSATLDEQTLFPCLGALHHFTCLVNALSPLIGLDLMLMWSGTPADELDATVEPALPLPQVINAGGVRWALNFTASQKAGEFSLALELPQLRLTSTANGMQLGHNKVRIDALHEAAVDPVVGQDKAWLWVQVISSFTRKPVAQVSVKWTAGTSSEVDTDEHGWSGFALAPTIAQPHNVEALVFSPYDGYEDKRAMTVNALASDPLKAVEVSFDRQPLRLLGTGTFFPRRKGEHRIEFTAKEGSALLDQEVTLGLTGTGPTALALSFSPPLGVPQRFVDGKLNYRLTCGDLTDGSFALRLAASRLQNLSPANALSLGSGSQVLKIIVIHHVHQTLDWEQVLDEQVKVVSAISGKPMAGVTVTWRSLDLGVVTTVTDFYGVARIRFKPVTTGAGELTATVGDEVLSDSVSLAFTLNEPRKISKLYEPDNPKRPVEWDSEVHALAKVVSSRTGEPLEGVEVMWEYAGRALSPSLTDADGIARLTFVLTAEGQGVLSAAVKGGLGGWDTAQLLYGGVVPVIRSLTSSDTSIQLGPEADAVVNVISRADGQPVGGISVQWAFPGLTLPPTATQSDGTSRITFTPLELGEYPLTATVGLGDTKSLVFAVKTNHAFEISELNGPESIPLFSTGNAEATVIDSITREPVRGASVRWVFAGLVLNPRPTDGEGKSRQSFKPLAVGRWKLTAQVLGHTGSSAKKEMDVTVTLSE